KLQKFLSQPFFVAQQFTGLEGKYVPIADTIRGFKEIVDGKHDEIPEQDFYMAGAIDEVIAKFEKRKKEPESQTPKWPYKAPFSCRSSLRIDRSCTRRSTRWRSRARTATSACCPGIRRCSRSSARGSC